MQQGAVLKTKYDHTTIITRCQITCRHYYQSLLPFYRSIVMVETRVPGKTYDLYLFNLDPYCAIWQNPPNITKNAGRCCLQEIHWRHCQWKTGNREISTSFICLFKSFGYPIDFIIYYMYNRSKFIALLKNGKTILRGTRSEMGDGRFGIIYVNKFIYLQFNICFNMYALVIKMKY